MGWLSGLLVLIALVLAGFGVLMLSSATSGVGLIGLACFTGILARIVQAGRHP